jgi:hypothetical protein
MPKAEDEYQKIVDALADGKTIVAGQMFGKPCLKAGGKAFVAQHEAQPSHETVDASAREVDEVRGLDTKRGAVRGVVSGPVSGTSAPPQTLPMASPFEMPFALGNLSRC